MAIHKVYHLAGDALIKYHKPKEGRAVVIGSKIYEKSNNRRRHYPDVTGIDMLEGEGVDIVHNLEQPIDIEPFAHVDCCSVLEHSERPWLVAQTIESMMEKGSTILLTVPFIWRLHAYPSDYWRFSAETLDVLFPNIHWYEKIYHCAEGFVDKPVSHNDEKGRVWFQRTELAAWGVM